MLRRLTLILAALLLLPFAAGATSITTAVSMKEADGTPDVAAVQRIVVTNGTLTDDGIVSGKYQVTLTTGGGGGGHVIEDEGTPLTARSNLDFTGAGVTCADNDPDTQCTVPGGLPSDPSSCPAEEFANDQNASGTLSCDDPFNGRTLDDLTDVTATVGAAAYVRKSEQTIVSGNCVEVDAQGDFTDAGAPCLTGGDVEDMDTSMTSGYGILSQGTTTLLEVDLATQAELDAQVTYAEIHQGELAILQDLGYAAPAYDYSSDSQFMLNLQWDTEALDVLGHWRPRSQGSRGGDWSLDDIVCWYPPRTHYVYVHDYCSGAGVGTYNDTEGKPCTAPTATPCAGSETCEYADWVQNTSPTPDAIGITGHDFGPPGTVYQEMVAIERPAGAPVHGSDGTAITCTPSNLAIGNEYWLYAYDANTVYAYLDDGDGVEEVLEMCTGSGVPYACCTGSKAGATCDQPMNCTDFNEWQGVTIFPINQTTKVAKTYDFDVDTSFTFESTASDGTELTCNSGVNHGQACTGMGLLGPACNEPDFDELCTGSGTPLSCCTADGNGSSCDWADDLISFDDLCTGSGTPFNCCAASGDGRKCDHVKFKTMCTGADTPWTCCTGTAAGATCPPGHNASRDGICTPAIVTPAIVSFYYSWALPEGVDETYTDWSTDYGISFSYPGQMGGVTLSQTLHDFAPGMCYGVNVYATGATGTLDTADTYFGSRTSIREARRSGPERRRCDYAVNTTIPESCLWHGLLTNNGAAAAREFDLPAVKAGMDFMVVNREAFSLTLDPNGTERFEEPATDTNGDYLKSDSKGDYLHVHVPSDGLMVVVDTNGGFYEE